MNNRNIFLLISVLWFCIGCGGGNADNSPRRGEVLFVGDTTTVREGELLRLKKPASEYASMLAVKLFRAGINLSYVDNLDELNAEELELYDALVIYKKRPDFSDKCEKLFNNFLENGKGIVLLNNNDAQPWLNVKDGRYYAHKNADNDSTWTSLEFQNLIRDKIKWAVGGKVTGQIAALKIPDISIYEGVDTITDMRKPHLIKTVQKALTPEESLKLTQVPAGFELQLFASEPDVVKPMAMAWDERGRLWVAETVDFPSSFTKEDGVATDRIKICEDTNGDGKADKFTVFADSLNIPTAIAFANGGVVIGQAPDIIFFRDLDGDDKADVRKVIATGWNKNDTHGGLGHFQYGFDNRIWGTSGMSGYNGGTLDGKTYTFGTAIFSIGTDGKNFKYHASTNDNTFGLGFTEDNNVFASSANDGHSKYYSMDESQTDPQFPRESKRETVYPVHYIAQHRESHIATPNFRQVDCQGGFTSACNHNFYTARAFPKKYWNRVAFVTDPTIHVVHNAIIERDGAGFKENDGWNSLVSADEFQGAVQVQVGPDGAVWIADFYSFVFQHFSFGHDEVSIGRVVPYEGKQLEGDKGSAFRTPLRDKNCGRIYRLVYKKAKKSERMELSKKDKGGLIAALKNDNMFWRMTAQRLLVELQDKSVASDLYRIIKDESVDEIGLNSPAVHALWTLHGLKLLDGSNEEALKVVYNALHHPAAGVRKAAIEVLPRNDKSLEILMSSNVIADNDLNVRLILFRTLQKFPASETIGKIVYLACTDDRNTTDKWLTKALLNLASKNAYGYKIAMAGSASGSTVNNAFALEIAKIIANPKFLISQQANSEELSPDIAGKEIYLTGYVQLLKDYETKAMAKNGLIYAHGDRKKGYALQLVNSEILFSVFQNGSVYSAKSPLRLKKNEFSKEISAGLKADGTIYIKYDTTTVAKSSSPGLFISNLDAPLRVGEDIKGEHRIMPENEISDFAVNSPYLTVSFQEVSSSENLSNTSNIGSKQTVLIEMSVIKDRMKFDKKEFTVKAGSRVVIRIRNNDGMQHNMVIGSTGSLDKIGAAADVMAQAPDGAKKNYVPAIPEVLASSELIKPNNLFTLEFIAPKEPGKYPFVCTFPGHWRMMNGIMNVTK